MRTPQSGQPGQEALARQGREAEGRFAEALAETNAKPHSIYKSKPPEKAMHGLRHPSVPRSTPQANLGSTANPRRR